MSAEQYANEPDLPTGWAIRRDGLISLRTASYRPEAAKINALVLYGDVHAFDSCRYSDEQINAEFEELAQVMNLEVVEVECLERRA